MFTADSATGETIFAIFDNSRPVPVRESFPSRVVPARHGRDRPRRQVKFNEISNNEETPDKILSTEPYDGDADPWALGDNRRNHVNDTLDVNKKKKNER